MEKPRNKARAPGTGYLGVPMPEAVKEKIRQAAELDERNMADWLTPSGWKRVWQRLRKAAGIDGKQDITRHTFASHCLAAFGEEATKQAMGHTAGSRVLFEHYRRAVTKEKGVAFFEAR